MPQYAEWHSPQCYKRRGARYIGWEVEVDMEQCCENRTYAVYGAVFSLSHASLSEFDHFFSWKYCGGISDRLLCGFEMTYASVDGATS